jgi:hypothetical protein
MFHVNFPTPHTPQNPHKINKLSEQPHVADTLTEHFVWTIEEDMDAISLS